MPTSSLGHRDVPYVILSCCSFQQHFVPGVDVLKHTKLVIKVLQEGELWKFFKFFYFT
ncbi:hypothetical protein Nmel_016762 [Mimus melanotis]